MQKVVYLSSVTSRSLEIVLDERREKKENKFFMKGLFSKRR
jgi:hypothetical protein